MPRNQHYQDDIVYITYLTRNILKVLGIWPSIEEKSTGGKIRKVLLISASYILLYCVLIPGLLFWLLEKRTRVKIQTMPMLIFIFMAVSKYGNLVLCEDQIRRCLKHVEEDWRNVSEANSRDTMLQSARTGRRLIALCATFMYGSGLFFRTVLPFVRGKIVTAQNVTLKPLPCPGYFFSVNIQVSPAYEIIFALQFVSGLVTFSITTGVCGLMVIFVMHACGQLQILIGLMRKLVEQWQKKQDVDKKLAEMVEHQIRIRSFLRLVEHTLQQMCLIELMGCTTIVCILGYCIIMESENSNKIAMFSYFMSLTSMLINMFLFCYTGEQLIVQAEKVASTSCELEWYRLPGKKARGIVLVIIISNLPTKVTAGKIIDLSYKTYGDVVKTAVTYFNMLRNVTD